MQIVRLFLDRLPSARILIGAALAAASYFISNIYKAEIDDELKQFSALANQANSFSEQLSAYPISRAAFEHQAETSRLQYEQLRAQHEQLRALKELVVVMRTPPATAPERVTQETFEVAAPRDVEEAPLLATYAEQEDVAMGVQMTAFQGFIAKLPAVLRNTPSTETELFFAGYKNADERRIKPCMTAIQMPDRKFVSFKHNELFAEKYLQAFKDRPDLEQKPATIQQAADAVEGMLQATWDGVQRVIYTDWLEVMGTPHEAAKSSPAKAAFFDHKLHALGCIWPQRDLLWGLAGLVADETSMAINQAFVEPRLVTRRRLEMLETGCYFLSGLIALFGVRATPPERAPDRNRRRLENRTPKRRRRFLNRARAQPQLREGSIDKSPGK